MQGLLAIIPAKEFSYRFPDKNVKILCGQETIRWTFEAAMRSQLFQTIVVSSNSTSILDMARGSGLYASKRPNHLVQVPVWQVCEQVIKEQKRLEREYSHFCLLLPTNPLRADEDIITGFKLFKSVPEPDFVCSISEHTSNAHFALVADEQTGRIEPLCDWFDVDGDAPSTPPTYYVDGAVYWAKVERFLEEKKIGSTCPKTAFFKIPPERAVNVDTPFDFALAKTLLRERLGEK